MSKRNPWDDRNALLRHSSNAFIRVTEERGEGPAVAVKDLVDVVGLPTTAGAPVEDLPPARADAPLVANLRAAGGFVIGKTNLFEWAYGVSSANRTYGDVENPRAPGHSAGGSSSGSAAAVAAELCDWAVGTDTAGSIRVPAALCGVVGFKPSRGLIPTAGVLSLSPSQDTVGSLAPTVAVAAAGVAAMSGDPRLAAPALRRGAPLRIAVPAGWVNNLDHEVEAVWQAFAHGLELVEIGSREEIFDCAQRLQAHEAWTVHRVALEHAPELYSDEVRDRVLAGRQVGEAEASAARGRLEEAAITIDRAFGELDLLVLPTTACVAPRLDGPGMREQLTRYTRPFNGTGQPAFSLPAPSENLPVGLQLIGRRNGDEDLIAAARQVERALAERASLADLA
jgi:aspartyl-tRNA(Asn)/glutamyl-tRNA(Gln) amidotransferase subunit A